MYSNIRFRFTERHNSMLTDPRMSHLDIHICHSLHVYGWNQPQTLPHIRSSQVTAHYTHHKPCPEREKKKERQLETFASVSYSSTDQLHKGSPVLLPADDTHGCIFACHTLCPRRTVI
uniref:Uncharacterized protein n=1 Tax=Arundo donax TaxID=35708 RepID=A0A0A9DLX6_ARUDO